MIRRLLCAALFAAGCAAAAPGLTTIQDVLYKADGARFNGLLTISWKSFQSADNSAIVAQTSTVKVIDGHLRVQLAPSSTATPAIVYTVVYNSDGRIQFEENWSVPPSSTPLRIRDVRVAGGNLTTGAGGSTGGPGSSSNLTSPASEADVTGLIADLAARPTRSPAFAAGRTAVVDTSGLLGSATGNPGDCVHVDGSSGPCGGDAPSFVDGDLPTGIVDGSNATFTLSAVPSPASSLSVYRNGMLQKPLVDYTATGNSIQFVSASTPQPGDTLLASYRTADSSGSVSGVFSSFSTVQVLCSGSGSTIQSPSLTSLGACSIPAGLLSQGDRIEIRFDYAHGGSSGGFSVEAHWGDTIILHRDATPAETLLALRSDAAVLASSTQLSSQSWGATLSLAANAAAAADSYAAGLTINFMGSVANGADTLTLTNFTVVRVP